MPTQKKIEQVAKIRKLIEGTGAVYFTDLSKIDARAITELRRALRKEGIKLAVAKNRLARRALVEAGISDDLAKIIRGPTSLVLSPSEEPYAAARALKALGQRTKDWAFKGAYVEHRLFAAENFDALAAMPSRQEARQQLVSALLSPIHQLVTALDGTLTGLVLTLDELSRRPAPPAQAASTEAAPAQ